MNTDKTDISRRKFMALAGGSVGFAAFAAAGLGAGQAGAETRTPDLPRVDVNQLSLRNSEADVLVVGGGMAGVFAAVKAHDAGVKAVLVSKGRIGASGMTPFARGIFAYQPGTAKMTLDEYVAAVSHSAMGTNNPIFTRQTAKHSLARVKDLESWGFFESQRFAESFSTPISQRKIPVFERVMLTHLIKEKNQIAGAAGFSLDDGALHFFRAKTVILCTGAGGFKPNGFPVCDLTHDGSVMAYDIGAKITGKEWNDGHGGSLTHPASVYDQWGGMLEQKPNIVGVGIRHDLGVEQNYRVYTQGPSRDSQDRPRRPHGMQANAEAGGPVRPEGLEMSGPPGPPPGDKDHGGKDGPKGGHGQKGGMGDAHAKGERGKKGHRPPPGMHGPPSGGASAGMAIHKSEGLVPHDKSGQSNIPGLYAAGDALGSHMCGGIYTQIGSSLAGSAVQGAIAGEAAAGYAKGCVLPEISQGQQDRIRKEITAPLARKKGYSPAWVTQTLQGIMIPNFVLYIKKESLMAGALAYIEELRDHHSPRLLASSIHELRLAHETVNMIVNAEMKLRASMMRKESRCSHYRLDYPKVDIKNWNAWINIQKGHDGRMTLEKQPFNTWPA